MTELYRDHAIELRRDGDTAGVEVLYPRSNGLRFVEVGLCDVRAADSLRISYDFDRDGWVVEQAKYFTWDEHDADPPDHGWTEVAFCPAWQMDTGTTPGGNRYKDT